MKTVKDFADLVKMEMKDQKITKRELADMAKISESAVYGFLNGYNVPSLKNVINMIDALGYDIALIYKHGKNKGQKKAPH